MRRPKYSPVNLLEALKKLIAEITGSLERSRSLKADMDARLSRPRDAALKTGKNHPDPSPDQDKGEKDS